MTSANRLQENKNKSNKEKVGTWHVQEFCEGGKKLVREFNIISLKVFRISKKKLFNES